MYLKFLCPKCEIPFIIEDKNLINKTSLCCPNCSTEFPKDKIEDLKNGISLLNSAKHNEIIFEGMGTVYSTFAFEISEKNPLL